MNELNPENDLETMGEERLLLHVEAIERLEEEKKGIADDIKDRYAVVKSEGYDPKVLKSVISRRAKQREEVEEYDAVLATYEAALAS